MSSNSNSRLSPDVNRILFIRNLPYKISAEDMYDLFGKYGSIRQIRVGSNKETRGTAFVIYDDIFDAKSACEHLSGYNLSGRYLIVLYHQPDKSSRKRELDRQQREIEEIKIKMGIEGVTLSESDQTNNITSNYNNNNIPTPQSIK